MIHLIKVNLIRMISLFNYRNDKEKGIIVLLIINLSKRDIGWRGNSSIMFIRSKFLCM